MAAENRKSIKLFGKIIYVDEAPENAPPPPRPRGAPPDAMPLPAVVIDAVRAYGGVCLTYIGKKNLTESDIKPKYSRLFIPQTHRLMSYLTGVEKEVLEHNRKFDVTVLDSRGCSYKMPFKKWPSTDRHLVFITEWMRLVTENRLNERDMIELWCYRVNLDLGFVVNVQHRADDQQRADQGPSQRNSSGSSTTTSSSHE